METLEYLVHWGVYYMIAAIVASPLVIVVFLLPPSDSGPTLLHLLLLIPIGLYVMVTTWIAHRAAYRRTFEEAEFFEAIVDAFQDLRFNLSMLPIVGRFFEKRAKR